MGGGFDRDFTKSLMIRDFDDVLKNPFRYEHLFLLHTLLSKKIRILPCMACNRGPKLRCYTHAIESFCILQTGILQTGFASRLCFFDRNLFIVAQEASI